MKIELDVSEGQLAELDKSLKDFLSTLTDDQKLTLLQGYINREFEGMFKISVDRWGTKNTEVTDLGKGVLDGMRQQISNLYVENYYMNNQLFKEKLDKECEEIQKNIRNIINDSIAAYIANNLFSNTDKIQFMMSNKIQDLVNQMQHPNYY